MSYLGIVALSVFGANALLSYGFAPCPASRLRGLVGLAAFVALFLANALAASLLWALRALVLRPLGLDYISLIIFVMIAIPLVRLFFRAIAAKSGFLHRLSTAADDILVSSIVFGIALISTRSGYSILEALVASVSSAIGYWMAAVLLDALRERLELSDVPEAFRGAPAMLISAGLMAMALMGFDAVFIKNLAG
ncbi:MAG TPA: Rnf-Nqr domain containing protein [Rectinemataceae bacterium]|nr:Rnf-Nqr domain containing protein [Rectinemataceae bacterium]